MLLKITLATASLALSDIQIRNILINYCIIYFKMRVNVSIIFTNHHFHSGFELNLNFVFIPVNDFSIDLVTL